MSLRVSGTVATIDNQSIRMTTEKQHEPLDSSAYGTSDRWFILGFLTLNYAVLVLQRNCIWFVLRPLKAELVLNDEQVGYLQTAFLVAYSLSQFFVGYLSDRFERRHVLMGSLGVSLLVLAGMGLVENFLGLMVMRAVLGVAQAASVPAIASVLADVFTPKTRSTAVAIWLCSYSVAMYFAGAAGGKMADIASVTIPLGAGSLSVSGWRFAMFVFALIGVGWIVVMALFFREPQRAERQEGVGLGSGGGSFWQTIRSTFTVKSYLMIGFMFIVCCIINNIRELWLPQFVGDVFEMNNEEAGKFSTFSMMLSMIVGNLVGGIWADWWATKFRSGRLWVQGIAFLVWIPSLLVIGFTNNQSVMIVGMMGFGFSFSVYSVNLWTTTFDVIDPAARATAIGLLNLVAVSAAFASPVVGKGLEYDWFDIREVFISLSFFSLLAFLAIVITVVFFLKRDYRGPLQ